MKTLFVAGLAVLLFVSLACAGEIEDTATELTILMVGKADPTRIDAEIADARTRVKRRYVDDKTTEMVVTGGYTSNNVIIVDGEYTDTYTWVETFTEQPKNPADNDILARLKLKLASIRRSMNNEYSRILP